MNFSEAHVIIAKDTFTYILSIVSASLQYLFSEKKNFKEFTSPRFIYLFGFTRLFVCLGVPRCQNFAAKFSHWFEFRQATSIQLCSIIMRRIRFTPWSALRTRTKFDKPNGPAK